MKLPFVIKISRPRFWVYLAGPFAVGFAFGANSQMQFLDTLFLFPLLFFLFPANILLYGINDVFDYKTDTINPKKKSQESYVTGFNKRRYLFCILCSLFFIFPLFLIFNSKAELVFIIFLLLSLFYSAPPIRFKSKPFFDFSSNILYVLPGVIGFTQIANLWPPLLVVLAAFFWTSGMHLFSAIPDIASDKKAHIVTTATLLGKDKSLVVCMIFWTLSAGIAAFLSPVFLLAFFYPLIPLFIVLYKWNIVKMYWYFPYINGVFGLLLFWYAAIKFF